MFDGRYGITAKELHEMVIDDLRHFCNHMSWTDALPILDRHEQHDLEQTIRGVIMSIIFQERRNPSNTFEAKTNVETKNTSGFNTPIVEVSSKGIPILTLEQKMSALSYCFGNESYEDCAGHLCDLLNFVAIKLGRTKTEVLDYYGDCPTPIKTESP